MSEITWAAVDSYFESALLAADPVLQQVLEASSAARLPAIQVSACQGKMLNLLAQMQSPHRILEIGTLGGYSAICLARALHADGKLVTIERDSYHAQVARQNFVRAGLEDRIEMRIETAAEGLTKLKAEGGRPFDFIFIDADKQNNLRYVQMALEISRPGTAIVVDNVVRGGRIVAAERDAAAEGVRRMSEWIGKEPRLSATAIQTVGDKGYDGFLMMIVQGTNQPQPSAGR
jgi:predicted O-methyltransferase YrrM